MFVSRKVSAVFSCRVGPWLSMALFRRGWGQHFLSHHGVQGQADVQLSKPGSAVQCKAKKSTACQALAEPQCTQITFP